ncbi:MAG: HepT-like ribonuclease domain-containing protein [Acidimicrobiales bacterium]
MTHQGRRDAAWTADILGAITKVERWRAFQDRDEDMFRSAVLRELGVIGEAVNGLSDAFKTKRPEIPWRSIIDLRNVLTHHYWDTTWTLIQQILEDDLGQLRRAIASSGLFSESAPAPEIATPPCTNRRGTCGRWMPRARTHCILPADHAGGCRSK